MGEFGLVRIGRDKTQLILDDIFGGCNKAFKIFFGIVFEVIVKVKSFG